MTRIYCPVTYNVLSALRDGQAVSVPLAVAVTPALIALAPDEDLEGHEHIATQLAAASAQSDPIIVAVFDVAGAIVKPLEGASVPGQVQLTSDVEARRLACLLIADVGERVSDDADLELSWYDASEVGLVLNQAR